MEYFDLWGFNIFDVGIILMGKLLVWHTCNVVAKKESMGENLIV